MSPTLPSSTQVLIIGAGPTGMTCAITLIKKGIQVCIVDSSTTNKYGSRAVAVHAHTLEALDTISLSDPLVSLGLQSSGAKFYTGTSTSPLISLDISSSLQSKTKFPYVLLIPQHETERVLEEAMNALGVEVIRGVEIVGYNYNAIDGNLEATFANGEVVKTKYLVGADGSRSSVRQLAGIEFKDPTTGHLYGSPESKTIRIVLADIYLASPLPSNATLTSLTGYFQNGAAIILIPFKPTKRDLPIPIVDGNEAHLFRFVTFLLPSEPDAPHAPGGEYISKLLDARSVHGKFTLKLVKVLTASRYRVRYAVADRFLVPYEKANVLLAGDASHVHSPVGAQGMNLGICDAVSLGNAIASHTTTTDADPEKRKQILENHAAERRSIALQVIALVERGTNLNALASGWRRWMLSLAAWVLWGAPWLMQKMVWRVSGLVFRGDGTRSGPESVSL